MPLINENINENIENFDSEIKINTLLELLDDRDDTIFEAKKDIERLLYLIQEMGTLIHKDNLEKLDPIITGIFVDEIEIPKYFDIL